ncbi:MAG: trypsin-like serine protease [Verrucomicrobiaceae bacterium]|nr:MAG: trypsin-like serine protease [Verrucomicrobiaceae bacterium]
MNSLPFSDPHHPSRRSLPPWIQRALPAVCAMFLLPSCTAVVGQMTMGQVDKALQLRKAPSLHGWSTGSREAGPLLKTVEVRTGLLLSHWDSISVDSHTAKNGSRIFDVSFTGKSGSISSAVPVTKDGYFLTAAHCVTDGDMTLVALNDRLQLIKIQARVVWSGNAGRQGPDLAIIQAPVTPAFPFQLARAERLKSDTAVAATGWSGIVHDNPLGATAAGRILNVSEVRTDESGTAWRVVGHDVPLNFGDSGGPLVLADGRLAGINSCIGVTVTGFVRTTLGFSGRSDRPLYGYAGEACLPTPEWLRGVIEKDRAVRRQGKR